MMKSHLFLAAVAAFLAVVEVDAQQTANPTIPHHLLPCYRNPDIYLRENRLSSKFRIFIDLVKKIESSPNARSKGAKEIAMALLYHLRLDGIQPTPNVKQTQDVTPFAPGGDNYYKHRLTLIGLLPRPGRPTNYDFLNDSLTEYEMCNLHFMLSYSIDPYKRENEDCSRIRFEDYGQYWSDSGYYGYNSYRSQSLRHKRDLSEDSVKMSLNKLKMQKRSLQIRTAKLRRVLYNLRRRRRRHSMRHKRSSEDREENLRSKDVEVLPPNVLKSLSNTDSTSQDFTLLNTRFIGPGENHILRGGYEAPHKTYESNLNKRTAMYHGDTSRILITSQQLSKCPIENGVIQHKYGSITIGAVVAGVAAGFYHQKISLPELNTELKGPLASERVNNIWGTTLAGNAADLILSLGHFSNYREGVGLRGGWDNLNKPTYYMLEKESTSSLTDVELRGALDGLWLGLTVEKHSKYLGTFSLSDILEMYYLDSGFPLDPKVKASKRGEEVAAYAPTEEFKKQAHLLAAVMKNQRLSTVTFTNFDNAVAEVVSAINAHIPQLSPRHLTLSSPSMSRSMIDQRADLLIVIDPSWGLTSLYTYIGMLIEEELGATPGQSNLTLVCPHDVNGVYPILNLAEFETKIRDIYLDCRSKGEGIHYEYMFELILKHYSLAISEENTSRRVNPYSFVTLLMLSSSQRPLDSEVAETEIERLRDYIPGIEIIVATDGPKERFKDFVRSLDKDIFSLPILSEDGQYNFDLSDLTYRIASVPRRIGNPAAGGWMGKGSVYEGDAELLDDARLGLTTIYRIDPFYLWNSGDIKVSVRTKGHVVTVCHGREQLLLPPHMQRNPNLHRKFYNQDPYPGFRPEEYPEGNDGDSTNGHGSCKTATNIMFDFENVCEDADSVEDCKPLYISIQAPKEPKLEIRCVNCRHQINAQYEVKVSGLAGNGAGTLIISTSLLLFSWAVIASTKRLY